jgi:hypothetical protein
MTQVVTLENFRPPRRYDSIPWAQAIIQEAATVDGTFATIDTQALSPLDADPSEPALRSFTTNDGTDVALWYQILFEDGGGNVSLPTTPIQNAVAAGDPYASVIELARILKIRAPTEEQTVAMIRVLTTAAGEIDAEVDRLATDPLGGWELSLVAEVNLERAVEHWQQMESPFGIIGLGAEFGATHTARDSWERHAHKLAPLKGQWGLA